MASSPISSMPSSPTLSDAPHRTSYRSTVNSTVFVVNALEKFAASKEARRNKELKDAVQKALDMLKSGETPPAGQVRSTLILSALQKAIETRSANLMTIALDCLGKFITYNYLGDLENEVAQSEIMERVVGSICDCFIGEGTDEKVQLQIVKALLDAVYSTSNPLHQSTLIKAVRTTYNIFLMSRNPANQNVAQVTLTQMVDHIFKRVKHHNYSYTSLSDTLPKDFVNDMGKTSQQEISTNGVIEEPALDGQTKEEHSEPQSQTGEAELSTTDASESTGDVEPIDEVATDSELYIRDAILVFCELIELEAGSDTKSYSIRSKLLSLHLILIILTSHMDVLTFSSTALSRDASDPNATPRPKLFILHVKRHLCQCLNRNAFSVVPEVFDITLEILWKMVQGLREFMKKELEVFFKEMILHMLEMRNTSYEQKYAVLDVVLRICKDPKTLVDIYLNYDCDSDASENIYERLVNILSRITTSHITAGNTKDQDNRSSTQSQFNHQNYSSSVMIPPPLSTAKFQSSEKNRQPTSKSESDIKYKSLECLLSILVSLVRWYEENSVSGSAGGKSEEESTTPRSSEEHRRSTDKLTHHSNTSLPRLSPISSSIDTTSIANGNTTPRLDDPEQFENQRNRKRLLHECIRQFNSKPKKGLQMLTNNNFIDMNNHQNVAQFLLKTEGLKKKVIGEYLGEGEATNISIMHALIDELDFTGMSFIEALRLCMQPFRLPGEAQKVDRFMVKFGERYVHLNPSVFENADTPYALAYSVLMLNTDQHSPQVKNRMTFDQFKANNGRIVDENEVTEDMQRAIFDDVRNNEIKLLDDDEVARNASIMSHPTNVGVFGMTGFQNALVSAGIARDHRREAYEAVTEELRSKTEARFKDMLASKSRAGENEIITFYSASHVEHVRPMFDIAWMAFMTGLSGPLQESDDLKTVELCLNGFKHAIHIICLFHMVQSEDMDLQRNAFVTTLIKFTFLSNLSEMKPKNVEAIKTLLEVAAVNGNYLKDSWREILSTVSQLERFQLITSKTDPDELPDISRKPKKEEGNTRQTSANNRRAASGASLSRSAKHLVLADEVASAGQSQALIRAADLLFTNTVNLNGDAIVEFVKALCETSWEEIDSSRHLEHPRMYSLQKLVEISDYNMNRIRMEWSNIWVEVSKYFNKVGCESSFNVVFFAVDSLRQLAMNFLKKDELPHFKFQKDFLMPFRDILANNHDTKIKDLVLRCLSQMIQKRAHHIRSGWKTMFLVFATSAGEKPEIVELTYDIVKSAADEHFTKIVMNGTFPDYITCLVEFAKNNKCEKIGVSALNRIDDAIKKMLDIAEKNTSIEINDAHAPASSSGPMIQTDGDFLIRFWVSVFYGLKQVILQSDKIEIQQKALEIIFDSLNKYGSAFQPELWKTISEQIVFSLFDHVKETSQQDVSEKDSIRMLATLPKALKNVADLYSKYFERMEDEIMTHVLDIFGVCLIQDIDALAEASHVRLYQYIETTMDKFDSACWNRITSKLVYLLKDTMAHYLFDGNKDIVEQFNRLEKKSRADATEANHSDFNLIAISASRKKKFDQDVIQKCIFHRRVIHLVIDLLRNDQIYNAYPSDGLLELMKHLRESFEFAKKFHADHKLRKALLHYEFMTSLPNLLKQETMAAGCYTSVLMRMFVNLENIADRDEKRKEIEEALIPCCIDIFTLYSELDQDTNAKNIDSWTPVLVSILKGLSLLQSEDFMKLTPVFYQSAIGLLNQESLLPNIRAELYNLLKRVGKEYKITQQ